MPLDFFGYKRNSPGTHIMSSEYAAVLMSNSLTSAPSNKLGLVQGCQVSYGHAVVPVFEAGSSEMYWITGQPSGAVSISRVVGDNFVAGLQGLAQPGSSSQLLNQGAIGEVDFKAGVTTINQTVLRFGGCVLARVDWSTQVSALNITTGMTIHVAILHPVNLLAQGSSVGTLAGGNTLATAMGSVAGAGVASLTGSPLSASVADGAVTGAAASLLNSL